MSYKACFRVALRALLKNKLQTALTTLGLIIGVSTVMTMFALGSGAQTAIETQVKAAGMNLITVASGNHLGTVEDDTQAGNVAGDTQDQDILDGAFGSAPIAADAVTPPAEPKPAPSVPEEPAQPVVAQNQNTETSLGVPTTLTLADAAAIRTIPGVTYVSEGVHTNARLGPGSTRELARVHGDNTSLQEMRRGWKFGRGRFYSKDEQDKATQVIVLGSVLKERLFGKENAVGQSVNLWEQPFEVIGVVESGSWMVTPAKGDDQFDAAYVPFTTIHRLLKLDGVSDITLTAETSGDVTRVSKVVTALLRKRHQGQRDDFTVSSQARKAVSSGGMRREMAQALTGNMQVLDKVTLEQMAKTLRHASQTMTFLLASVAAVSLLVGGIGIMNTMLLSVTERTREIGIRRAIGARSRDVLQQFLMEATVLSVSGGLLGVILGLATSVSITRWAGWATSVSALSVVVAFGSAAATGILFGYYPARQASVVAPIESLRYE